jgi:hypothetical protein
VLAHTLLLDEGNIASLLKLRIIKKKAANLFTAIFSNAIDSQVTKR